MFLTLSLSVCFSFFLNVSYDLLTGEALQDISQLFSCQQWRFWTNFTGEAKVGPMFNQRRTVKNGNK